MWLFTIHGFFSVVCAKMNEGKSKDIDPFFYMVRARRKQHLVNLMTDKDVAYFFTGCEIVRSDKADYRWRVIIHKWNWMECMKALAKKIDFGNFKKACKEARMTDKDHELAMVDVWSAMNSVQAKEKE